MKLHSEKLSPLHHRGKRSAILAPADGGFDHRRPVGVREIDKRILGKPAQQPRRLPQPATGSSPRAAISPRQETSRIRPANRPEPAKLRRLLAGLKHPLHAQTNSKQRNLPVDRVRRPLPAERPTARLWLRNSPRPAERPCRPAQSPPGSAVIDRLRTPRWSNAFFTEARFPAW